MSSTKISKVVLACATKISAKLFSRGTLLGRSLQAFPGQLRPQLVLLPDNKGGGATGLPAFYNRILDKVELDNIIIFLHDDVYLHDWNLAFHLCQALDCYDLVGVVGSAQVPVGQPGWWHDLDQEGRPRRNDAVIRSGSINHFDPGLVRPDWFGPSPMACDLLDGVFLAAYVRRLRESGVRFDPQFRFHCYDTDFCYSARSLGLRLGTWPIPLTHGSPGGFDGDWIQAAQQLQSKLALAQP